MRVRRVAIGVVGAFAAVIILVGAVAALTKPDAPAVARPPSKPPAMLAPAAPAAPAAGEWPELANGVDAPKEPTTLDEAIERYLPLMDDRMDAVSVGSVALAVWSAQHLTWSELAKRKARDIRPGTIHKDIDASRGKLICTPRGRLIEIAKQHRDGRPDFFAGLIHFSDGQLVHFLAVRSTGTLVAGDGGSLCGVVTGTFTYHNSAGGIGHAIELVGMFDLPANTH